MPWVLITSTKDASSIKKFLEDRGLYDKKRKIAKLADGEVSIPITTEQLQLGSEEQPQILGHRVWRVELAQIAQGLDKLKLDPREKLKANVTDLLSKNGITCKASHLAELPNSWEAHGDLILLPGKSFQSTFWGQFGEDLWNVVAASLGARRIAKKSAISNDDFRTPNVKLLLGENGIVHHVDNRVKYTYDITKCMFSSGNVTEKIRIGKLNCAGETVVDLYSGIGYFVLPYLVHAKASLVYACEWNEHAVKALKTNIKINGVEDRCSIHEGDNRKFPLQGIADRVNLGLIPSSEAGWPVACAVLKSSTGGWLHIHGNVSSGLKRAPSAKLRGRGFCGSDAAVEHGWEKSNKVGHKRIQREGETDCRLMNKTRNSLKNTTDIADAGVHIHDAELSGKESKLEAEQMPEHANSEVTNKEKHSLKSSNDLRDTQYIFVQEDAVIPSCNKGIRREWVEWAGNVVKSLRGLLHEAHSASGVDEWSVSVGHLEHVKSYAPHISHLVLDVECRPLTQKSDQQK